MTDKGCLVSGASAVILGRVALQLVKPLQIGQDQECWIDLKDGTCHHLQQFWDGDLLVYREHIQREVDSPQGPVVFLCLVDNTGQVVEDSQLSLTEMGQYVQIADLKVARKSG